MQLQYRILWLDDQEQAIRPFITRVQGIVSRLGFEPEIDFRVVTADVVNPLAGINQNEGYDLVLMDWKLGGKHDGAVLARRLRQMFRDTDIIFYSSEPAASLRKLIFDQNIDGVFCVAREHLSDRANGIVHGQLRRVLDLNHMRGIVMAATSDLDQGMIECLGVVQQVLYPADSAAQFASQIGKMVSDSLRKKADEIEKLGAKGKLSKLLKDPAFGASLRLKILVDEITKLSDKLNEPHLMDRLGRYQEDVIAPRNDFAHRKAEVRDGKLVLEGRENPIDHDTMRSLRLRLLDHYDNLRGLLSMLGELANNVGETALADQIAAVEEAVTEAAEASAPAIKY